MKKTTFRGEIVLPSLLWRIDEAEETSSGQGVPIATYRAEVLRNLRWLLSSSAHRSASPIWKYSEASGSVVNFGITPYTGTFGSYFATDDLARSIKAAILRFEPRILAESLSVEPVDSEGGDGGYLGFVISGNIWNEPVPERFSIEASIDAASGSWKFGR